jgi:TonB family protein
MKPPVVISEPPTAQYTREARKKKIQEAVTISLLVTEEGLPADIHIVKGLGHGLDENAIDTAGQYRFRPATLDGKTSSRPYQHRSGFQAARELMRSRRWD